jgi:hypothetical protein
MVLFNSKDERNALVVQETLCGKAKPSPAPRVRECAATSPDQQVVSAVRHQVQDEHGCLQTQFFEKRGGIYDW